MVPKYVITGTPKEEFTRETVGLLKRYGNTDAIVKANADLFELHQLIQNEPVDLLLGGSYGKAIPKAENIPLVRDGFPILDRYAHSYLPLVGYTGMIRMVERITNTLLDRQDAVCADEDLELVM
jgi:nitrogenase molybdenum-iron protein beta chain